MSILHSTLRFLGRRTRAYTLAFSGEAGQIVLGDLIRFCRGLDTTFHDDARMSARLQGRQEVWLRIRQHLALTPEQLFVLYNQPSVIDRLKVKEEEDNG